MTFKIAFDMLCMSGSRTHLLNELRVDVADGNDKWVSKVAGKSVTQISLNRYFRREVVVTGVVEDTFSLSRRRETISYWNCYHIAFDTLKAIIGCIGVRSTPYKCLRIEMGFGLLKNIIPPECGHTEKINWDTVIIRIDLERHDNYGHFYSTFFHEMVHVLTSFDCSEKDDHGNSLYTLHL